MTRLWLDANVVLRFLTGEPVEMAREAKELMARAERGEVALVVADLVMAETVWVLRSFYGHPMDRIRDTLSAFAAAPGIEAERSKVVREALDLAADENVDFVDAYLALRASRAAERVCTFDSTDFKRLSGSWARPGSVGVDEG